MAGRLARILEQEYKTKGLVGGLASAGGKRLKEMFDIRNVLFSGGDNKFFRKKVLKYYYQLKMIPGFLQKIR